MASLSRSRPTGKTRHVADGVEVGDFAAVAIARYESGSGVHLFYCDADWNVVTDTEHASVGAAVAQANFEFGLLPFREV